MGFFIFTFLFNPIFANASCTESDLARARTAINGSARLVAIDYAQPNHTRGPQNHLYEVKFCAGQISLKDYCHRHMTGASGSNNQFRSAPYYNKMNRLCRGQVAPNKLFRCSLKDVSQIQRLLAKTRNKETVPFSLRKTIRLEIETRLCARQVSEEQFCKERFVQLFDQWRARPFPTRGRADRTSYVQKMDQLDEIAQTHLRCAQYIKPDDTFHKICSTEQLNSIRAYRDSVSTSRTGQFTNKDRSRSHVLLAHTELCAGSIDAKKYCDYPIPRTQLPEKVRQKRGPTNDTEAFDFAMGNQLCQNLKPPPETNRTNPTIEKPTESDQ